MVTHPNYFSKSIKANFIPKNKIININQILEYNIKKKYKKYFIDIICHVIPNE